MLYMAKIYVICDSMVRQEVNKSEYKLEYVSVT